MTAAQFPKKAPGHEPERKSQAGPAAPLGVGIIGVGAISDVHIEGYQLAGARVVALADVSGEALAAQQEKWQVPRAYAAFHELLEDPEVDMVSICAPTVVHHPATLAAAAAGKHVLCEKPVSLNIELGREMIDACERAGVVFMVGHQLRSHGAAAQAKALIASGALGDLTYVRLRQAHDWGGHGVRPSFATKASAGGGTLLDNGCHLADLARYLAGNVDELYCRVANRKFAVEVEDTAHVSLRFTSGALGSIEVAWTATGWEEGFWIYGTEGALEYTNRNGTPELQHRLRTSPHTSWGEPDLIKYSFGGAKPHHRHVQAFVDAIKGEREVLCSGLDGLEAVRLILNAYESAESGMPVRIT